MQITVVGDEIRVDGATVGALWGGPHKEREALREALRSAPELEYAGGAGWFGEPDDDEPEAIMANNGNGATLRPEVEKALVALKKYNPSEALKILAKALA